MNSPHPHRSELDDIEHQAAAWVLRRDRGLTAAEQDEFSQWLAGDPRRRDCLARHGRNWDRLDQLTDWRREHSPRPNPDLLAPPGRRLVRFWTVAPTLSFAAAALVIFAMMLRSPRNTASATNVPPTALAMIEQRVLDDGSQVELNRGAEIVVQFTPGERRVRLEKGEAHFTVTKNPARPFIVSAGKVDVRAVGTAFNVLLRQEGVEVLVTEGRVQVDEPKASALPAVAAVTPGLAPENVRTDETGKEANLVLDAGQRATLPHQSPDGKSLRPSQITTVSEEERDQLLAWQPKLLDFTATPLSAIVVEFNQRNPVQIVIGETSLRLLRISASFRSDNIEGFVRLLEASFGVRAERVGLTITLHRAMKDANS